MSYPGRLNLLVPVFLMSSMCVSLQAAPAAAKAPDESGQVSFKKTVVDTTFRAEGVATGDVNHDGLPDILAGEVWYEAPNWKMHELRPPGKYDGTTGYSKTFANFAYDVNGDGWVDSIITTMMGEPCRWYENPMNKSGHWTERIGTRSACNETPLFADLLGDGARVPLFGVQPEGLIAWFGLPADAENQWDMHVIAGPRAPGSERYSHGLGVGDMNGDGRNDVVVTEGWWEAPQDRTRPNWKFHRALLGPPCADMLVYDVDADGDSDVITSSAHEYGIWWYEQKPDARPKFTKHLISKEFSQTHAMRLGDINRDGIMDFVTGKRYFAHNGNDPGSGEPAVLYWFEIRRPEKAAVEFIPHLIDDDSGIGTQFDLADMNGDRKPDIVTSNKKGVHVFLQQ